MKKNNSVRGVTLGLAGVTALTSFPGYSNFAMALENEVNIESSLLLELTKNDFLSSLEIKSSGSDNCWYEENNKVHFNSDCIAVVQANDSVTKIEIVAGSGYTDTVERNTFTIDLKNILSSGSYFNFYTESDMHTVLVDDYFKTKFGEAVSYELDIEAPDLSDVATHMGLEDETSKPSEHNGYYKSGIIRKEYSLKLSDGEFFSVTLNDEAMSANSYSYDKENSKLELLVDLQAVEDSGADEVNIRVSAFDLLGNSKVLEDSFVLDLLPPSYDIESNYYETDGNGNAFIDITEEEVVVKYSFEDNQSGVKEVELFRNDSSLGKIDETGNFNITESGVYKIVATDNVGNTRTVDLFSGYNVVFDESRPKVKFQVEGIDDLSQWHKGNLAITIDATDDTNISRVTYSIGGLEQEVEVNDKEYSLKLNSDDLIIENGVLPIKFTAYDVGGETSIEEELKIDNSKPELENFGLDGNYSLVGNVLYITSNTKLVGNPKNGLSGIAEIEVFNNNGVIGNSLPITLTEDGSFGVRLVDNAGNEANFYLKDVLGIDEFENVIIDDDKPLIEEVSGFDGYVEHSNNKWYSSQPEFMFRITDIGLKNVEVKLNSDIVIDNISSDSLYKVSVNEVGKNVISVKAEDYLGNISTYNYEFYADWKAPQITKVGFNKEYNNLGIGSYFKKSPELSIEASEEGIGIDKYYLCDKDGKVLAESNNGKFKLDSGVYYIKVADKLGHESDLVSVKSKVEGMKSNVVVVDAELPVIKCTRPDGDVDAWYKGHVEYIAEVSDNLGIAKATISVNGKEADVLSTDGTITEGKLRAGTNSAVVAEDGSYHFVIEVTDNSGNKSTWEDTIYLDTKSPVLENKKLEGDYVDKPHGVYFKKAPKVILDAKDYDIGSLTYHMMKNSFDISSNESGEFTLVEGDISFRLEDKVGNINYIGSLASLFGLQSSNVVIDNTNPTIECERPSGDLDGWYRSHVFYDAKISDDNGIAEAYIESNGVKVFEYSTDDFVKSHNIRSQVNTEDVTPIDGYKYNIKVVVTDNAGNISSWQDTIYVDKEVPVINKDKCSLKGDYVAKSYGTFFKSLPTISIDAEDTGVGVGKYSLVREDGEAVIKDIGTFSVPSGVYAIQVMDKLNNVTPLVELKDLFGFESNSIYIDSTLPKIVCSRPSGDLDGWYSEDVTFNADFKDSLGINEATISFNGVVVAKFDNPDSIVKEVSLEADTSKVTPKEDYAYDVVISVKDNAGNVSEWKDTIYVDKDVPVLTSKEIIGAYTQNKLGVFFKESPKVKLGVNDAGVGLGKIVLTDSKGKTISNTDGVFGLITNNYTVDIVDKLGNTSALGTLQNIFGLESNNIIVDGTKPVINCTRPDGGNALGWFSKGVGYKASVSDEVGIAKATMYINGVEVDTYVNEGNNISKGLETAIKLNGDTSDVKALEEYIYNVKIVVEDMAGNYSEWLDTIYVDTKAPELLKKELLGSYKVNKLGVFFKESPEIKLTAEDTGVGLKEVVLIDSDGKKVSNEEGVFTLTSNEYTVELVDKLDNTVSLGTLQNIFGLESNRVIVDGTSPLIDCKRPEGGNTDGWFEKDVEYKASISDGIGISKATLYINGVAVDAYLNEGKDLSVGLKTSIELRGSTADVEAKDGYSYTIKVVTEDMSGNYSEWVDSIFVDSKAPELTHSDLKGSYKENNLGVFFKESPVISFKADDTGVGLDGFVLVGSGEDLNTKGVFKLKSGSYSLEIKDKLGNTANVGTLQEIFKLQSNNIYIDGVSPSIDCVRPSGDINNWFAKDVEYVANIGDNLGIEYAELVINGKVVDTFDGSKELTTSGVLKGDTSSADINVDGSYNITIRAVDFSGNITEWEDVIYKDITAPKVSKFVITEDGYKEGSDIGGSKDYGFYINGATEVEIMVDDGEVSSGLAKLHYSLLSSNGAKVEDTVSIVNNVAIITIPKDFKGYVQAYAVDMVGNIGNVAQPDGIITETSNLHINNCGIDITIPETAYSDIKGISLYNDDVSIKAGIKANVSGVRTIEWGVGSETRGTVIVDNDGKLDGDVGYVILSKDENLAIALSKSLVVGDDLNNLDVWVKVVDRVGHVSEKHRTISIDKTLPKINVSYDNNIASGYYKDTRTATITIDEVNFRQEDVKITGNYGTVGNWSYTNGVWVCPVVFSEDGDYNWSVEYTDMAGNKGVTYNSESFTIDKTTPQLSVTFDNNSVENDNFYRAGRIATVKVVERNFDPSLVSLTGSGTLGAWSSDGDTHTCQVVFNEDGEYEFSIGVSDKSGNVAPSFSSGKFIIDKKLPGVGISGVQNGVSYKGNISFSVSAEDTYIDTLRSQVSLVGRTNGEIKVVGAFSETSGTFTFNGVPDDKVYDDLYTLVVNVYDKAGNVINEEVVFSINRYGSDYMFTNEHMIGNIVRNPENVVLKETSVDRLNLDDCKVVVILDGKTLDVDKRYISISESGGSSSPWVYTYTVNKGAFSKDGKYQVQIYSKSYDGTDNSSLTEEFAFILDTTEPEIILSGIENDAFYSEVSKKVIIEVRDLSGISSIKALLNGIEIPLKVNEDGFYYLEVDESNERQNLEVVVVDIAGNSNIVKVENFLVSSSIIQSIFNTPWAKVGIGAVVAGLGFILFLLFRRRKEDKVKEAKTAEETAQMYRDSSTGGSSSNAKDK